MPETAKVNGREDAPSTAEEPGIGANKVVLHPVENSSGEIEAAPPSPEGPQQLEAPKEPQPELHIRGDKAVRYERVAKAMSAAREAGVRKIGFITEPDPK